MFNPPKTFRSSRSNHKNLVKYDSKINKAHGNNEGSYPPKLTVETQKNQRKRNDGKFPKPKFVSIKIHDRLDNRISLPRSHFEKLHSEQGIQNVKGYNKCQKKEYARIITVYITTFLLIVSPPDTHSSPEKGISA